MIAMLRDSGPPSRLSTGIDQLDAVLGGGIPRYSAVFVSGLPGTGLRAGQTRGAGPRGEEIYHEWTLTKTRGCQPVL